MNMTINTPADARAFALGAFITGAYNKWDLVQTGGGCTARVLNIGDYQLCCTDLSGCNAPSYGDVLLTLEHAGTGLEHWSFDVEPFHNASAETIKRMASLIQGVWLHYGAPIYKLDGNGLMRLEGVEPAWHYLVSVPDECETLDAAVRFYDAHYPREADFRDVNAYLIAHDIAEYTANRAFDIDGGRPLDEIADAINSGLAELECPDARALVSALWQEVKALINKNT